MSGLARRAKAVNPLNGRGPGPVTTRRRRGNALDLLLVDDPLLVDEYVALLEHNLEP